MASLLDRLSPSQQPAVSLSAPTTSTITETAEAPPTPPDLASLPAFRPPRTLPPSGSNPDPAPKDDEHQAADPSARRKQDTASIPGFIKQRAQSYAKVAGVALKAAGGYLNMLSGEIESEAFLPDEDDLSDIPPPLGRLAARRIKLGADPEQLSDIEDIGMAAVGIGIWLVKGLSAVLEARRDRRRLEAGRSVHTDSDAQ